LLNWCTLSISPRNALPLHLGVGVINPEQLYPRRDRRNVASKRADDQTYLGGRYIHLPASVLATGLTQKSPIQAQIVESRMLNFPEPPYEEFSYAVRSWLREVPSAREEDNW